MLFATSTSIAACVELNAGNANIDLGDGHKASFVLPDIGMPYVIDAYPIGNLMGKSYGFSIYAEEEELAKVSMYVYSSPQQSPIPKARTEDPVMPDIMGPRVYTPKTIDGAIGYVGYDLQKGASSLDTSNAMTGFFRYFPGARKVSDSLESTIEVSGEAGGFPSSVQSLQVFNSLVDSIKISGPGI